jgi:hypothetical protein
MCCVPTHTHPSKVSLCIHSNLPVGSHYKYFKFSNMVSKVSRFGNNFEGNSTVIFPRKLTDICIAYRLTLHTCYNASKAPAVTDHQSTLSKGPVYTTVILIYCNDKTFYKIYTVLMTCQEQSRSWIHSEKSWCTIYPDDWFDILYQQLHKILDKIIWLTYFIARFYSLFCFFFFTLWWKNEHFM